MKIPQNIHVWLCDVYSTKPITKKADFDREQSSLLFNVKYVGTEANVLYYCHI